MSDIHLAILLVTACLIAYADHLGWQYMRGVKTTLSAKGIEFLHWGVWVGLMGMLATGSILAYDRLSYLLSQPVFILKMCFVLVLVVNAIFIGNLSKKASTTPYVALSKRERLVLNISAAASTISWLGAATIGYFFL